MSVEAIAATAARVHAAESPQATERLLTLHDCREAAQVSRWTLWDWTTKRGLRTVQIGGVTRIRERDWLAFLNRHATAAPEGGKQ